jgi:hypothetical protein
MYEPMYSRFGFAVHERCVYCGEPVVIMVRYRAATQS